jgi:outer membrane biosynthesis protein TonB
MSDIAQTAIDKAQARIKIDRWLNEYVKGVSDHKLEAIALADAADFERGDVEATFDDADKLRAAAIARLAATHASAAAKAKPEPEVVIKRRRLVGYPEPKAEPAQPAKPKWDLAKALDAAQAKIAQQAKEEAEPEPAPEPTAEPAPAEAEPEAEEPKRERFRLDEEAETPVLSKAAPMDNAKVFARDRLRKDGVLATYYYHSNWWQWNGRFYEIAPADELRGAFTTISIVREYEPATVMNGSAQNRKTPML